MGTTNGLLVSKDKGASWQPQGAAVNIWQGPFFAHGEERIEIFGGASQQTLVFNSENLKSREIKDADEP